MNINKGIYIAFSFLIFSFCLIAMKSDPNAEMQSYRSRNKSANRSPKTKSPKFRNNIGTGKKIGGTYTSKTKKNLPKSTITVKTKGKKAVDYNLYKQNQTVGGKNIDSQRISQGGSGKENTGEINKIHQQENLNKNLKTKAKKTKIKSYRIK
ncbi:MAG TPA: hypothetical protein QF753_14510 [Victivallales bacterium]|nr:hypothetical protein [Victivallales bacterium]